MLEGKDNLKFMIPFEWTSSKHISLSHSSKMKKKNNLRIPADHFFPFILEKHNAWLDILSQMFSELGISQAFLFKELLIFFSSKSALLQ